MTDDKYSALEKIAESDWHEIDIELRIAMVHLARRRVMLGMLFDMGKTFRTGAGFIITGAAIWVIFKEAIAHFIQDVSR